MEGLGKDFDVVAVADGVWINMEDVGSITFFGLLSGGDTFTIKEATSSGGADEQDLDVIDHWFAQVDGDGTDSWTRETQSPADAAVTEGDDLVAIHVDATMLSDGFTHLECTATSTGVVWAVLHNLAVQRTPENLPVRSV
jgi:hypothetical protein